MARMAQCPAPENSAGSRRTDRLSGLQSFYHG
jgi:hypothetical protein